MDSSTTASLAQSARAWYHEKQIVLKGDGLKMDLELLRRACALLEEATPLKTDCGLLCDAACCRDNQDAGSGVWLMPGEDAAQMDWGSVGEFRLPVSGRQMEMLYCTKMCSRPLRPFLCRIFPLTPYYSNKTKRWDVRMDRRAAALCPLFAYGKRGLAPEFVQAAGQAVGLLAQDADFERILIDLQAEEEAIRRPSL